MNLSMEECEVLIEEHEPDENKIAGYLSLEGNFLFLIRLNEYLQFCTFF